MPSTWRAVFTFLTLIVAVATTVHAAATPKAGAVIDDMEPLVCVIDEDCNGGKCERNPDPGKCICLEGTFGLRCQKTPKPTKADVYMFLAGLPVCIYGIVVIVRAAQGGPRDAAESSGKTLNGGGGSGSSGSSSSVSVRPGLSVARLTAVLSVPGATDSVALLLFCTISLLMHIGTPMMLYNTWAIAFGALLSVTAFVASMFYDPGPIHNALTPFVAMVIGWLYFTNDTGMMFSARLLRFGSVLVFGGGFLQSVSGVQPHALLYSGICYLWAGLMMIHSCESIAMVMMKIMMPVNLTAVLAFESMLITCVVLLCIRGRWAVETTLMS